MGKPEQVANLYIDRFNAKKQDAVAIIAYGNKYVSDCNKLVRAGLGFNGLICEGDRIVLNQNYYGKSFAYVGNGEVGEIKSLGNRNTIADLSFIDVEVEFKDSLNLPFKVHTKVMLDTLKNPNALTQEKKQALYAAAFRNTRVFQKSNKLWDDEYLSAMQIGYGHAFSCHKAQGSEWDTVLLNTWSPDNDYRFLYTGVTRARKHLFTNSGHLMGK
jgi:exodeoxyribonuclease-5